MTTLGELYDVEAEARIDAGPAGGASGAPRGRNHRVAAGALVVAIGLGVRDVFEPKASEPIVEDLDLDDWWGADRIRITGMELGPRATVAWVRSA